MISVARRYHRSISLTLDWGSPEALKGYLVSPLVRNSAERMLNELTLEGGTRTWSIVGPYGTGKSAYALFVASLLASSDEKREKLLRQLQPDTKIKRAYKQAFNKAWMPILIVGERMPILESVLRALLHAVQEARPTRRGKTPLVEQALTKIIQGIDEGEQTGSTQVLAMIDEVSAYAQKQHSGLLFIFDELGKFLEYSANQPGKSDIYFLQQLAERASRSQEFPVGVITVLHQSFSLYADNLPERERQEWEKVQGRYNEIPFLEPVDHLIRLAGNAIEIKGNEEAKLQSSHAKIVKRVAKLVPKNKQSIVDALEETFPLHPIAAMLLGPVFRGALAQNERSLFAFLVNTEPGGFGAYLQESGDSPSTLYTAEMLFDYVSAVLATRVSSRRHERMWGLAEKALAAAQSADASTQIKIIKALSLIERFGPETGIAPTLAVLSASVGEVDSLVKGALEELDRFIVYRKSSQTYHLWDGSDIDLQAEISSARSAMENAGNIAGVLEQHIALRPIVAGRHLQETGSLRFLEPRLVEEIELDSPIYPEDRGNGLILYVLPHSSHAGQQLIENLQNTRTRKKLLPHSATVVVVAHDATRIREQALSLLALDHALNASKSLEVDLVARRELQIQLNEASNRLQTTLAMVFSWGASKSPDAATWFMRKKGECSAPARLSSLASDVMDSAFHSAPHIHNELLNRNVLSSQASAARRQLVKAMIEEGDRENLGIAGHPPSKAMYLSVIKQSGMHQPSQRELPWKTPEDGFGDTWEFVLEYLQKIDEPLPASELYQTLQEPPYGIRAGAIPVLLIAQLLAQPEKLTLFEDGSLVPFLDAETTERLLSRPKTFSLRAFKASDERDQILRLLISRLETKTGIEPTVLNATKALLKVVKRLSEYAQSTNQISRSAKAVRTAILSARDPHKLIFEQLPKLLELKTSADEDPDAFVFALLKALQELKLVEEKLYSRLFDKIIKAFGAENQEEVVTRFKTLPDAGIASLIASLRLRITEDAPKNEWLYSIATFLTHRPPDKWRDSDEPAFDLKLKEASRLFRRYETLASMEWGTGLHKIQVSVLSDDGAETTDLAVLRDDENKDAERLATEIYGLATKWGLNRDQVLHAMASVISDSEQMLSDRDNLNALFIADGLSQQERLNRLNKIAIHQMTLLAGEEGIAQTSHSR